MEHMQGQQPTYISLSAVKSYQRCQQLYAYRYIERIQRKGRVTALELGSIVHNYMDEYYGLLKLGAVSGLEAHETSLERLAAKWQPQLKKLSQAAFMAGEEATAKEMQELYARAESICCRYFAARGSSDAERYKILHVELQLETDLVGGKLRTRGYTDLIAQDQNTGRVSLWEHKTAKNVPEPGTRLQDLQTLLYAEQLAQLHDIRVDEVIWNYLRTKEPTVPKLVYQGKKNERMEIGESIDTTWEIYAAACLANGQDPESEIYAPLKERLSGRELTAFFPRWPQVIVADSTVLLRDYARTGLEIRRFRERVASGTVKPIKTLEMHCGFCEFSKLCQAEIMGGDTEDLKRLNFETAARRSESATT